YGIFGALVTTYVTFVPSFIFIFIAAPYVEALAKNARLQAALTGVTSAVVGVIFDLALFFALHVLFPGGGGLDVFALIAALVSFVALWHFKTPIHILVPLGAVAGMLWKLYS
ncbi:MAG TPA: chromate transporter, partial [Anaerolineae bacterium]